MFEIVRDKARIAAQNVYGPGSEGTMMQDGVNDTFKCDSARRRAIGSWIAAAVIVLSVQPAAAQQIPVIAAPPFTATLSNTTPLVFGMDAGSAARVLGAPLNYVSGRPGDEIFLAIRTAGGSGLFDRRDRLYLQFRHGRLTGWKGDWGRNWMWQ